MNPPIAVLIWLMILPMLMKVGLAALRGIGKRPRGLFVTLFVDRMVKPFSLAFFAPTPTSGRMRLLGVECSVAAPGAMTGACNFIQLTVATVIALCGPGSGAARATVVRVLIDVPGDALGLPHVRLDETLVPRP